MQWLIFIVKQVIYTSLTLKHDKYEPVKWKEHKLTAIVKALKHNL